MTIETEWRHVNGTDKIFINDKNNNGTYIGQIASDLWINFLKIERTGKKIDVNIELDRLENWVRVKNEFEKNNRRPINAKM